MTVSNTFYWILCVTAVAFISAHESYLTLRHVGLTMWQKFRIDEYFEDKFDLFRCIHDPVECLLKAFDPSLCVPMKQLESRGMGFHEILYREVLLKFVSTFQF
jgi:hypothetical protein